jgi:transcriptional regulator with XRE-family HTH domain
MGSSSPGLTVLKMAANKGNGKAYRFLQENLNFPHGDWCIVWPFARDKHGRGMLGYNGKHYWAHRLMCTMAHGEPPTPEHTAAHNCGNGHGGCVNPHHLEWKTQAENLEDCRAHGTIVRNHHGNVRRLLPEEIKAIRDARGFQTQCQLAAKFGISEGTVSDIWHGRTHRDYSKVNHWRPEDDAKLKQAIGLKMSFKQASKLIGRPEKAVAARAYRIGLKSGYELNRPRNSAPAE